MGVGGQEVPLMMEVSSKTLPSPCRHCADATGGDPEAALALEDQDSGLLCLFKGSIFQVAGVTSAY